MKNLISALFIVGSLTFIGCSNGEKERDNQKKEIDTNKLVDYSLRYITIKLIEQGKEIDSLNNYYDSLDKRADSVLSSLKKTVYKKKDVIKKEKLDSTNSKSSY